MSGSVTATWNLDRSAAGLFSIAKAAITAASTDNVQISAIIAGEKFGNTLAICDDTINIIETKVIPNSDSPVISFLRGYVGFAKNDCIHYLGNSHAGVRFVSLAAALITSMEISDVTQCLDKMLRSTTNEFDMVPSQRNLRALILAIEPHCTTSGFTDMNLVWYSRLYPHPGTPAGSTDWTSARPDANGVNELIASFRQLRRIGEASAVKIVIKTRGCTPWVASLTEWCLGKAPAIFAHDGRTIFGQGGEDVCIIHYFLSGDFSEDTSAFGVRVYHTIHTFEELISDVDMPHSVINGWRGMASIKQYGKWLLQQNGLDSGEHKMAFEQVIPYALHQVLSSVCYGQHPNSDEASGLYPYTNSKAVLQVLSLLTGMENTQMKPLENRNLIQDLPFIASYFDGLRRTCLCKGCRSNSSSALRYPDCEREQFYHGIADIIADTIALALFIFPDDLYIRVPRRADSDTIAGFRKSISLVLSVGASPRAKHDAVLALSLTLAGHDVTDKLYHQNWVASSNMGQAIWPSIFETFSVTKYGFLSLRYHRGTFHYKGDHYTQVESAKNDQYIKTPDFQQSGLTEVMEPRNLFPTLGVNWLVYADSEVLKVGLGLTGVDDQLKIEIGSPSSALNILFNAFFVESCSHAAEKPLERPDQSAAYTHPAYPDSPATLAFHNSVHVVPVSGMDSLRFFSVARVGKDLEVVLRGSACLSCCLHACRNEMRRVLIL